MIRLERTVIERTGMDRINVYAADRFGRKVGVYDLLYEVRRRPFKKHKLIIDYKAMNMRKCIFINCEQWSEYDKKILFEQATRELGACLGIGADMFDREMTYAIVGNIPDYKDLGIQIICPDYVN